MDERLEKIRKYKGGIEDFNSYIEDRIAETKKSNNKDLKKEVEKKIEIKESMESTKTYYDIQRDGERDKMIGELFMKLYEKNINLTDKEVNFINECIKNSEDMHTSGEIDKELVNAQNEGIVGGIIGGVAGLAFGSKIGGAICKALGITTGPLYQLLNSKVVTTAICAYLGLKA